MQIILDIETRGDRDLFEIFSDGITAPKTYKDPKKIADYIKWKKSEALSKMAVDTDFSEILLIGIKEPSKAPRFVSLEELGPMLETCNQLVTYNGKNFDIPIIIKSGIKAGVNLPYKRLRDMTIRYKTDPHVDLFEVINEFGKYKSLDTLLQVYCDIAKTPIDFATCPIEELTDHCVEDLINTELLFEKFKRLI